MSAAPDSLSLLNQQLAALAEAGVPVDLGIDTRTSEAVSHRDRKRRIEAERTVEDVTAGMAVRTSLGQPLEEALEHGKPQSQLYRYRMLLGLKQNKPAAALEQSQAVANAASASNEVAEQSLGYPLIVMTLAYVGVLVACTWLTPTMVDIYEGLAKEPSWSLQVLMTLRATMPFWAIGVPLLVLFCWLISRWTRTSFDPEQHGSFIYRPFARLLGGDRFTGRRKSLALERHSTFADLLASLLNAGQSLSEAIPVAARATSGLELTSEAPSNDATDHSRGSEAEQQSGQSTNDKVDLQSLAASGTLWGSDSPFSEQLPPLLRWAIYAPEAEADRPTALAGIAETYRQRREELMHSRRSWAPAIAYPLLAGGVTLLYALLIFVPLIELVATFGANTMRYGQPW